MLNGCKNLATGLVYIPRLSDTDRLSFHGYNCPSIRLFVANSTNYLPFDSFFLYMTLELTRTCVHRTQCLYKKPNKMPYVQVY